MADAARAARLADRIKVIVAKALERRVKDPRLGFVTITDARVTNDLQHATLYYTVFGSEEDAANTKKALESAKGILRAEVGKNITARLTPTLTFVADEVPENAFHIEALLRETRERDAALAAAAEGAQYAGEADPYKKDEPAEGEDAQHVHPSDGRHEDKEVGEGEEEGAFARGTYGRELQTDDEVEDESDDGGW